MRKNEVILTLDRVNFSHDTNYFFSSNWKDFFVQLGKRKKPSPVSSEKNQVAMNLSLEVREGDRIALMGKNGVGKSTLCKLIAGKLFPDSGKITLQAPCFYFLEQLSPLYPDLSGRENMTALVHILLPEVKSKEALIEEIIHYSELGSSVDTPIRFYSRGMQSRLFLSLMSCVSAPFLILDEILDSGADRDFTEKLKLRFENQFSCSGAVLFVSHSLDSIRKNANRVWVLKDGKIAFDGEPEKGIQVYCEE